MNLPTRPTQAAFLESTADGHPLGGFTWRHLRTDLERPVVIINAATSVRCRHYSRFADYLFANGFDVITYDYRGIGESRPASMKTLQASWSDWGALDFEAMLMRAQREFPGQPIDVVGHSFGGCAAGLVLGKQAGIFGAIWAMCGMGIAQKPAGASWTQLWGLSLLCGIGFTMSMFIASLAFEHGGLDYGSYSRLGILVGSTLAAVIGFIALRISLPNREANQSTEGL